RFRWRSWRSDLGVLLRRYGRARLPRARSIEDGAADTRGGEREDDGDEPALGFVLVGGRLRHRGAVGHRPWATRRGRFMEPLRSRHVGIGERQRRRAKQRHRTGGWGRRRWHRQGRRGGERWALWQALGDPPLGGRAPCDRK